MLSHIANVKSRYAGLFLVPFLACVLTSIGSTGTSALDMDIGVSICGNNVPAAAIDITQPVEDSVVNQPTVTFRGTVANTSMIEVEIDGQYASTVSVGPSEATFEFNLTLDAGTRTVGVRANAVCGGQVATDTVALTYQPISQPSGGGSTPTVIGEQAVAEDGTPIETEPVSENNIVKQIEQIPLVGAAVSIVSDFATAVGLESKVINGNAPAVAGVARVGVTVAALTSVVMASSLAPIAAQAVPGVSEIFNASSHRSMIYLGWAIRGVGVLAMAFAYFL